MNNETEKYKTSNSVTQYWLRNKGDFSITRNSFSQQSNVAASYVDWLSLSNNVKSDLVAGSIVSKNTIAYRVNNSTSDSITHDKSIDEENSLLNDSNAIFFDLKETSYQPGYLSPADKKLEDVFKQSNISYVISLLNILSMKCFEEKKINSYLHFLNLLKNATFYLKFNYLKSYAVLGIAHHDAEVKDMSLSLFESFDFESKGEIASALNILTNLDTSAYDWLTDYKKQIIFDLEETLGEK